MQHVITCIVYLIVLVNGINYIYYFLVIFEEAAEILESHIVTSLSAECNHLILIGKFFHFE